MQKSPFPMGPASLYTTGANDGVKVSVVLFPPAVAVVVVVVHKSLSPKKTALRIRLTLGPSSAPFHPEAQHMPCCKPASWSMPMQRYSHKTQGSESESGTEGYDIPASRWIWLQCLTHPESTPERSYNQEEDVRGDLSPTVKMDPLYMSSHVFFKTSKFKFEALTKK